MPSGLNLHMLFGVTCIIGFMGGLMALLNWDYNRGEREYLRRRENLQRMTGEPNRPGKVDS